MKTEKLLILTLAFTISLAQQVTYDTKAVLCLVCKATMVEMEAEIAKVDPRKKIEVGGFRMTSDGDSSTKTIQYSKSETYLTELMENVCDKLDDYARARYKSSGKLTLIKFMVDGGMNPEMSKVDFIQDEDLNKSLKHLCLEVLEDNEEAVVKMFMEGIPKDSDIKLCSETAHYCNEKMIEDDYNYMETDETDGHTEL